MLTRLRHSLRIEDALLFGWLVLLQPLLVGLGSDGPFTGLSQDDPLVGLVYLAAAAGAVVALATRRPGAALRPGPHHDLMVSHLRGDSRAKKGHDLHTNGILAPRANRHGHLPCQGGGSGGCYQPPGPAG